MDCVCGCVKTCTENRNVNTQGWKKYSVEIGRIESKFFLVFFFKKESKCKKWIISWRRFDLIGRYPSWSHKIWLVVIVCFHEEALICINMSLLRHSCYNMSNMDCSFGFLFIFFLDFAFYVFKKIIKKFKRSPFSAYRKRENQVETKALANFYFFLKEAGLTKSASQYRSIRNSSFGVFFWSNNSYQRALMLTWANPNHFERACVVPVISHYHTTWVHINVKVWIFLQTM